MAEAQGPMSPGGGGKTTTGRLDGPPPLPSEAKRKAPTNWAAQDDMGLGMAAADPMVQIASASKQIEDGISRLAAAAPQLQPQLAGLTTAIRQMAANALVQQPGPPGMGGFQAPMPMPPAPQGPPAPQAGPPAVQ